MKDEYVYEPHRFVSYPVLGKQVCINCGLINTNNDFVNWAVQKGCLNKLHPQFENARLKYTNLDLYLLRRK